MKEIAKKGQNKKNTVLRISVIAVSAAAALCTIMISPRIKESDVPRINADSRGHIITRFPLRESGVFSGRQPDSAIYLSWYDNTMKLEDGAPTAAKLGAVLYPVTIPDRTLIYTVSNEKTAEIDMMGNILAKKPGSVEITVSNECTSQSSKAFLNIIQPVTGMYLQKSTINLYTTDMSIRLGVVVLPENASNSAVRWYSKDSSIVEVDQTGHLKPIRTGMTEVVATASDGGFSSKCFVNVINEIIKAESVSILNKGSIRLNIGDTWMGMASVLPSNAKNTYVQWESSNKSVASVTGTGLVKGLSAGTATITAKNPDGPSDSVTVEILGTPKTAEIDLGDNSYEAEAGVTYVAYEMTLDDMVEKTAATNPTYNDGSGNKNADRERIRMYVDPNEFCTGGYKYQFMDLSHYNGVDRDVINDFLEGKGILSSQADAFIEAAKQYNVSELYLIAHACVETGYGRSTLANGVNVNGTTVYNMYGIGAYDYDAVGTGSRKAYEEGWNSPAKAIKEGAHWISDHYVNASGQRQNTLYKMRWNPDEPGVHLYAGDVQWAVAQALIMEKLFNEFPEASIAYEIPVYAGSNAAKIDDN